MSSAFEEIFRTTNSRRDKFLSRLFGVFSEEVVRYWCREQGAQFDDLGRPTLFEHGAIRGHTLDFTLRDRASGRIYVAEMKCELEFESYRYLRLMQPEQIEHHRGDAFRKFLAVAGNPRGLQVRVGGRPIEVDGIVLIWGAVTEDGRRSAVDRYGFAEVLSVEAMLEDLRRWRSVGWGHRVTELRSWADHLFDRIAEQPAVNGP